MTRRSHQSPKDAIPPVMRGVKATMIGLKDVIGGLGAVSDRLTAALEGLRTPTPSWPLHRSPRIRPWGCPTCLTAAHDW